ncbi:protein disulfide isomerase-like 2-1 [Dendronephthya gigantea]|uniref:protein disulfide isomerase-like 2-1 n=1 Tax=Dendronephthya gigantea TaxID=151771 RepID=UPI0010696624|nr:protein disulfide isomerase-like 2-1 [Dendronephthya gigantea]
MASHGNVLIINNDTHFRREFEKNNNKLVVVDFTASWCGPCQRIAPVFEQLSNQFTDAVFLKVDVDQCREAAASFGIRAMPTFLFFLHGQKVDEMKGADPETLREKIQQWAIQSSQSPVDSVKVAAGRQLDCFRELLENSPDMFDSASQLLLRIANNIVQEPNEPKYRTLKLSTNTFQNKLLPVKGAVECLFAMGFVDNDDQVVLEAGKSLEDLKMIRDTILDERNKREVLRKTMHRT